MLAGRETLPTTPLTVVDTPTGSLSPTRAVSRDIDDEELDDDVIFSFDNLQVFLKRELEF